MKSTIDIDINDNNEPFIRISYVKSEDLRDKVLLKFINKFNSVFDSPNSILEEYKYAGISIWRNSYDPEEAVVHINPLEGEETNEIKYLKNNNLQEEI